MSDTLGAVLVTECPTEAEARALPQAGGLPYRGIWHTPPPQPAAVHLFAADDTYPDAMLRDTGWTRAEETR